MAISINKVSKEIQDKVIADYKAGKSMRQIEKDYGVTRPTVSRFLEKIGVKTTKGNHHRLYFHNEDYFENIDTEHKAYWLGFMFADGYITNNENRYGQDQFGLSLAEEDKEILYKFKEDLKATNPILQFQHYNIKGQDLCRLHLTSQKSVNDLIDKGCVKNKSLILEPPNKIPDDLIHHFIRGFFDGDGSITKTLNQKYNKYIYGVNVTTTQSMAEWLQNIFDFGSVVKEKRRDKTYYFNFGGNNQLKYFYHYLYDDATIYMQRKYDRFQEFLKYSES